MLRSTSISTPGVHVGDDARARSLARRCNELAATMMQKRPDRFGGFAALPLPDVDGALDELAYALDVLKLDGVVLFSNSNGVYLGENGSNPCSRSWKARRRCVRSSDHFSVIRRRISWDCRIRLSTSPPTPLGQSHKCSIQTGSPGRRVSNTSSRMPAVRSLTWRVASPSSTRWASFPGARSGRLRQQRCRRLDYDTHVLLQPAGA